MVWLQGCPRPRLSLLLTILHQAMRAFVVSFSKQTGKETARMHTSSASTRTGETYQDFEILCRSSCLYEHQVDNCHPLRLTLASVILASSCCIESLSLSRASACTVICWPMLADVSICKSNGGDVDENAADTATATGTKQQQQQRQQGKATGKKHGNRRQSP